MPQHIPVKDRFWTKVRKTSDCWEWTAATNPKGYGIVMVARPKRGPQLAHRVAYELEIGPIPDGLYVLHHCDNPGCVNPGHLYVGDQFDNMRDAVERGRARNLEAERRAAQTHCKYGHEFTPKNTRISKQGWRQCRACARARYHANKEAA